jgi:hypothetical protein
MCACYTAASLQQHARRLHAMHCIQLHRHGDLNILRLYLMVYAIAIGNGRPATSGDTDQEPVLLSSAEYSGDAVQMHQPTSCPKSAKFLQSTSI